MSRRTRPGFDVGDVLSQKGGVKHDGDTIFKSATVGAYACIMLCIVVLGGDNVVIVSATITGLWNSWHHNRQVEHWVVRFLRQMGIFDAGVPEEDAGIPEEDAPGTDRRPHRAARRDHRG